MAEHESVEVDRSPSLVSKVWDAITKDGTLAAAWRQGADEIGIALKAFPDSIHAEEPGTILNPTQGEIADDRKPRLPSPSEIAKDKQPYSPDQSQDHGQEHGHGR
jgi:hypothetical protein